MRALCDRPGRKRFQMPELAGFQKNKEQYFSISYQAGMIPSFRRLLQPGMAAMSLQGRIYSVLLKDGIYTCKSEIC